MPDIFEIIGKLVLTFAAALSFIPMLWLMVEAATRIGPERFHTGFTRLARYFAASVVVVVILVGWYSAYSVLVDRGIIIDHGDVD